MPTSSCAIPSPDRNAPTHVRVCQRLILALAFFAVVSTPAAAFDLSQYRLRAATDRAAGLAEGWQVLDAGVFENDPAGERLLLWYMGAAAAGASIGSSWSEAMNTRYSFPLWENILIYTLFLFLVWMVTALTAADPDMD